MAAPAANLEGFREWAALDVVVLGICLLVGVIIGALIAGSAHRRLMRRAMPQPGKPKHQFVPKKKKE
jgi:uncharacterized membrane-anchored protein YhcB (DUF1043 family)